MLLASLIASSVAVACGGSETPGVHELGLAPAEVERAFAQSGLPLFNTNPFSESDQSVHAMYASFPPEKAGTPVFVVVFDNSDKAALSAVPSATRYENVVVFYGERDSPARKRARESAIESLKS